MSWDPQVVCGKLRRVVGSRWVADPSGVARWVAIMNSLVDPFDADEIPSVG